MRRSKPVVDSDAKIEVGDWLYPLSQETNGGPTYPTVGGTMATLTTPSVDEVGPSKQLYDERMAASMEAAAGLTRD